MILPNTLRRLRNGDFALHYVVEGGIHPIATENQALFLQHVNEVLLLLFRLRFQILRKEADSSAALLEVLADLEPATLQRLLMLELRNF